MLTTGKLGWSIYEEFPDGPVTENLPVNAEDTGSIPGLRRFHMSWGKQTITTEPMRGNYWSPRA